MIDKPLFTEKLLEVFRLMPTHSCKEMSRHLGVSLGAVKSRRARVYQVLRVRNRTEAVMKGIYLGIIDYA